MPHPVTKRLITFQPPRHIICPPVTGAVVTVPVVVSTVVLVIAPVAITAVGFTTVGLIRRRTVLTVPLLVSCGLGSIQEQQATGHNG